MGPHSRGPAQGLPPQIPSLRTRSPPASALGRAWASPAGQESGAWGQPSLVWRPGRGAIKGGDTKSSCKHLQAGPKGVPCPGGWDGAKTAGRKQPLPQATCPGPTHQHYLPPGLFQQRPESGPGSGPAPRLGLSDPAALWPLLHSVRAIVSLQGLQKYLGSILPGHLQPPAKALSPTSSPLRLIASASFATPPRTWLWPRPLRAVDSASSDTEIRPSASPCLEKKPHPSQSFPGQFSKPHSLPRWPHDPLLYHQPPEEPHCSHSGLCT